MILPTRFQLGPHEWRVVAVPGMIRADDGDLCRGLCKFDELTCYVNTDQPPTMVRHTFMHELLHAALWSLGSKLTDDEGFVDSLSGALVQVFDSAVVW